ncbi:PDZ domain-containing protein [Luteolibacter luteus]|uniref:PDZ domain-containing protein n=1 Tax=Luteolibacter luteus TaxID=2728835 RepID=A0A858RPT4_9BACT|nr:PDZ domain-containing protein [Luteolibacter luteus]QJE98359.1 PDZ domain-containing protein [Luteolibacter luteus]
MKRAAVLLLIALSGFTAAEETRPEPAKAPDASLIKKRLPQATKTPWLGLQIGPLPEALRAHVPALPPGFGFLVSSVDPDGPAEKAGIQAYDILWKFDDQWITNGEQMLALLRLRNVEDEVKLGIYREGKELSLPVKLEKIPDEKLLAKLAQEATRNQQRSPDVPMKEVSTADGTAAIQAPEGKVVMNVSRGVAEVKITSVSGSVIFEGPVTDAQGVSQVPQEWRPHVGALQRALTQTPRLPRARSLPPVAEKEVTKE